MEQLGKYDFTLDMETENSNSAILKNIQMYSKVLEIGCAYGRMTKYLKENLHCKITIVEMDMSAGNVARQWANTEHIGYHFGNIESEIVRSRIKTEQFDYIIFADVLEHLHNPQEVLNEIKSCLAPNGSIWISIPNVGHNAVLIDLLNDKFTYRKVGLLDETHIHLFTVNSLEEMIASCGLRVENRINLVNAVEHTEFNNAYTDLPVDVANFLRNREYGEVYQFVWELKLDPVSKFENRIQDFADKVFEEKKRNYE